MKNKLKLNTTLLIIIIILLLLVSILLLKNDNGVLEKNNLSSDQQQIHTILPDSFKMKITGNFTSSGASRFYEEILTFANKNLITGNATYDSEDTYGKKINVTCMIKNQQWIDTKTNGACSDHITSEATSITKEGLENQIKTGSIKPLGSTCGHDDLCYELTN